MQTQQRGPLGESDSHAEGHLGVADTPVQQWLEVQCNMLQGVHRGMIFDVTEDASAARLVAFWPHTASARDDLIPKVLVCASRNEVFLQELPEAGSQPRTLRFFQPVVTDGDTHVIVLEMGNRSSGECRMVANLLRWNSEWLRFIGSGRLISEDQHLPAVYSLAVSALDQKKFRSAATALVTALATEFACQRVSLGLRRGSRVDVQVLSHSARFQQKSNLLQAISAAMDEAVDHDCSIVYPRADGSTLITQAHSALAGGTKGGSVCSVPMSDGGAIIGVITLEREADKQFSADELQRVEQVAALVAPALWLRYLDEQSLYRKFLRSLSSTAGRIFGPAHIRLKLALLGALALISFLALAQGDWRITADAVIEGSVQRTIAAPVDGYIASASARAGDVLKAGEQISALDDSDLRLERLKWSTLRQQMISESREARANGSRAEVSIINARIEQANAELKLVDEQLSRTRLVAPFDGIVIEGDLSRLLGTPVKRGDTLFKIAPLDGYRVVLRVDEEDIGAVNVGQEGRLLLASLSGEALRFVVTKLTPVSTATDGRNYFRVEANLRGADAPVQPGMEGVGKIEVGEARLIWIWTHSLINWLRLQLWTWWR